MTTLTKSSSYTYTPGDPGVPATAGSPAIPGYFKLVKVLVVNGSGFATLDPVTGKVHYDPRIVSYQMQYIWVDPVPAVIPTPGRPAVVAVFSQQLNFGWTATARSIGSQPGDGNYKLSVFAPSIGVMSGYKDNDTSTDYPSIQYGIYFAQGRFTIIERGVLLTAPASFTSADVFAIERRNGQVKYYQNGNLVYTSATYNFNTLFAAASMYAAGDAISSAALTNVFVGGVTGNASLQPLTAKAHGYTYNAIGVDLQPLQVTASGHVRAGMSTALLPLTNLAANRPYGAATPSLLPLATSASGHVGVVGNSSLAPMTTVAANRSYGDSRGALAPLGTVSYSGFIIPSFAVSAASLTYLTGYGHVLVGQGGGVASVLAPVTVLAADHAYADSRTKTLPFLISGGEYFPLNGVGQLSAPSSFAGALTAAGGEINPNAFVGSIRFSLSSFGGAQARMSAPTPSLMATGIGVVIGRAKMTSPTPVLSASGTVGSIAKSTMTLSGHPSVVGFSGAVVSIRIGGEYTLLSSGTSGSIDKGAMRLPLCRLRASGYLESHGGAALTSPMLLPVGHGRAVLVAPGYELVAYGSAVVAASYEAYSINLLGGIDRNPQNQFDPNVNEVTHYTNYPFTQILRFEDSYYGVGSDGLYLLEGDTDAGAPIAWSFRTALSDFNSKQLKRVKSVYIGARLISEITVTLVVGEKQELTYSYTTPRGNDAQNYRVPFGKGVRTRYAALELSDTSGNFIEIDTLDLENETLERAI